MKKAAPRKALPAVWNLEQLDEELRSALGLTQRPGLVGGMGITPFVVPQKRQRAVGRGAARRVEYEDVPWTQAQQDTIYATMAAHVATPYFGEKPDANLIRLILGDADFDAYLVPGNVPTNADTVKVVRKLIRSARALARMARGEAT